LIPLLPPACVLIGDGADLFGAQIRNAVGEDARLAPAAATARSVGRLGARLLARGGAISAERAVPRYLRRAEAEVVRTGERFEAAPKAH
jgi:tRNA A37 threonylcarbamoyladenosine modification protein TsaB